MKVDGVFQGGGVKGIAFVGAVCCLEEKGYEWEKLAGTSAGSIIASLLAVGYSGIEMKRIMLELDYLSFLDKDKLQAVPLIGKPMGLISHKGAYSGRNIEKWLIDLFKKKGKTKFKHVSMNGVSRLKVIASDISRREILILPDDLVKYGVDPMEFEIWKAVRMSVGIPFYFNPVRFDYDKGSSYIVDGGLLSNFPIWIFDVKGIPRWPTFGFKFTGNKTNIQPSNKTDIMSYLFDIIGSTMERNEEIYLNDKDSVRTMTIPIQGIKATQFSITKEQSQSMYNIGYNTAAAFANTWDFYNYVKRYRSN